MRNFHRVSVVASSVLAAGVLAAFSMPAPAQSLLDKLKHATQTVQQATQTVKQTTDAVKQELPQGSSQTQGQNCGALGAGCLDYLDTVTACMAPLKGYHAKTWADVIDQRLASGGISAAQRQNLEEDLAAYRTAEANHTDTVDSKISGRMFEDLPQADQVEANRRYGVFYNQIMGKCNGADHMQVGHTTKLNDLKH